MGLPRRLRLRRRADFIHVSQAAQGRANRLFVVRSAPNSLSTARFGFSVGKRVGGAVTRNLVKRRLREAIRRMEVKEGLDVVIIARPAVGEASFGELESALGDAFSRAGILINALQTKEWAADRQRREVMA